MRRFYIFMAIVIYITVCYALQPRVEVLRTSTDQRGLTSVKFKYGCDTMAYDYLTPAEFKQFLSTGNPYDK